MTKRFNQYIGKAGHLMMMSEFLIRGWNVAIPEVDVGDDILVVQDDSGELKRVQVKTSQALIQGKGYTAQFSLSLKQLSNITESYLYYAFIIRKDNVWIDPVILSQSNLFDLYKGKNRKNERGKISRQTKSSNSDKINIRFTHNDGKVFYGKDDISKYCSDYSDFPIIEH